MIDEKLEVINKIKKEKNVLAKTISTMSVSCPRCFANNLFDWYLFMGIYGRNMKGIRKDLGVEDDFDFLKYMGVEHLNAVLEAITKYNAAVENKKYFSFERVKEFLIDRAYDEGTKASRVLRRSIQEKTNEKNISVYKDLLQEIEENIISEDKNKHRLLHK